MPCAADKWCGCHSWEGSAGCCLRRAAHAQQPQIFDAWQLGHFCMMSTYKTFSFVFSILKASVSRGLQSWSCEQNLNLSSLTSPASLFSSFDMLTRWMVLYTLWKLTKAVLAKGSIQSIQQYDLRGIRYRTGNKDVLHLWLPCWKEATVILLFC